jgi:DNA-binding XRE family transcriptional regulator
VGNSKQDQLKIFFRIDKDLIHKGNWAKLSSAAKSVYPVFGRHTNSRGETYVSQETVAEKAGTSRQRVGKGVRDLAKKLPGHFRYSIRHKEIKKVAYSYIIVAPPPRNPATIRFYKEMIDEGHWKEMSKAAHAVYIAMRGLAGKEEEQKANWVKAVGEGVETYGVPYMKVKATKTKIAKAAGISPRRINNVFKELMHMLLVNPMRYDQKKQLPKGKEWKVYVVPVYSPAVKSEDLFEAKEDLIPIKYDEEYDATDDLETGHSKFKKRHFDSKKRHSVTESSLTSSQTSSQTNRQKPEKGEASNSFHSLKASPYEMGLQEEKSIGDQESSPGEPGALTSRSGPHVESPETPVREKVANHITTDWNKRDCKQCMYRDNDDDIEYCTVASSEQENTIGEMEYCPKDE